MGDYLTYSLSLMIAARIGLQVFLLWIVFDLYKHSNKHHVLYAGFVYALILMAWILDGLVHFTFISRSDFIVMAQDGIIPLLISICLLSLTFSSKTR